MSFFMVMFADSVWPASYFLHVRDFLLPTDLLLTADIEQPLEPSECAIFRSYAALAIVDRRKRA